MIKIPYRKIDAFATADSNGNPAACLYFGPGDHFDEPGMLDIAQRHKGFVSEVVYCFEMAPHDYLLRYFSSECEVDFCGHGTIACMHNLIGSTPELLARDVVHFRTRARGRLSVINELRSSNTVYVASPAPRHLGTSLSRVEVADALGVTVDTLSTAHPLDCIDAGLRTLIVPIGDLPGLIAILPDEPVLKRFCEANEIDIVLVWSTDVAAPEYYAHTRVFAPRFGYLEDPATGSGNSAFGRYILKNGLWDGFDIGIEQGAGPAFNAVRLVVRDDAVLFGGGAVTRIEGWYRY